METSVTGVSDCSSLNVAALREGVEIDHAENTHVAGVSFTAQVECVVSSLDRHLTGAGLGRNTENAAVTLKVTETYTAANPGDIVNVESSGETNALKTVLSGANIETGEIQTTPAVLKLDIIVTADAATDEDSTPSTDFNVDPNTVSDSLDKWEAEEGNELPEGINTDVTVETAEVAEVPLNECTCITGVPLVNAACLIHGGIGCKSCNEGFHLHNKGIIPAGACPTWMPSCAQNLCTCENGFAATGLSNVTDSDILGSGCYEHGLMQCDYKLGCEKGYFTSITTRQASDGSSVDAYACNINQCSCLHGEGATGANCTTNGNATCASCPESFENLVHSCACPRGSHIKDDNSTCLQNECDCLHGTGAVGLPLCEVHGATHCNTCDSTFEVKDGVCGCLKGSFLASEGDTTCTMSQCECPHGTAHSGESCEVHGATSCDNCDGGFDMKDGACGCAKGSFLADDGATTCTTNQCECPHGTAHLGNLCEVHGATSCDTCENAAVLKDGACTCVKGSFFADDGATTCTTNQCECPHGTGHSGERCDVHGATSCDNCDSGFIMKDGACGCAKGSFLADDADSTCTTNQCE